jgi:hypothetical protein
MNHEQATEALKKHQSHGDPYFVVYDDFLPYQEFGTLKSYLTEANLPFWTISNQINRNDKNNNDFYMATMIYHNENGARNEWIQGIDEQPFINISSKLHMFSLLRMKANLYVPSVKGHYIHAPHVDYDFGHQGALFFVTTCDAPTYMFDGTPIESIENRLLLFNPGTPHASSAPTNVPFRITININYIGQGIHASNFAYLKNINPSLVGGNPPFRI